LGIEGSNLGEIYLGQIRNSAKAIIIKDGKLLCTKNKNKFGIFYLLPGGGQEPFETIIEA